MTILGYDINGQPLLAGDRVVLIDVPNPYSKYGLLQIFHVLRDAGHVQGFTGIHRCFVPSEDDGYRCAYESVRKLPPKQADNQAGSWEEVRKLTGWVPEGVASDLTKGQAQDIAHAFRARSNSDGVYWVLIDESGVE